MSGAVGFLIVDGILVALEIALSFDNVMVNANKLEEITPVWQQRFLSWYLDRRFLYARGLNIGHFCDICLDQPLFRDAYGFCRSRPISPHYRRSAWPNIGLWRQLFDDGRAQFFVEEGKSVDWLFGLETRLRWVGSI